MLRSVREGLLVLVPSSPDGSDVGGLEKVVPHSADENFSRVPDELVAGG